MKTADERSERLPLLVALQSTVRVMRIGLLVLVLVYLCSGITFVAAGESGMVVRMGVLQPSVHPPGLVLALPRPIDRVVIVPGRRVLQHELEDWSVPVSGGARGGVLDPVRDPYTVTGDHNILRGRFSVRYRVDDPALWILASDDHTALLHRVFTAAATRVLAGASIDDILTARREEITAEILELARARAAELQIGVEIVSFDLRELIPPPEVLPAFQNVVNARVEAETLVDHARNERATRMPATAQEAHRLRSAAESRADEILQEARGAATAFAAVAEEAAQNPDFIRLRRHEYLREIMSAVRSKTFLHGSGADSRLVIPAPLPAP